MTFILTFMLASTVMTTLFILILFGAGQRRGGCSVELARENAYTAAPETKHKSRKLSSWRV